MIEELKAQIEKVFGKKINSRGDCELLSDDLHRRISVVISYNTLRRLYGLAEYRQPRTSTLNHLSNYIGYKSYQDFTQRFAEVDSWPAWEKLYVVIAGSEIDQIIDELRYRQLNKLQFAISFTIVTRELLLRRRVDLLVNLFRNPFFQFSEIPYDEVAQIGVLTGLIFRTYSNDEDEKVLLSESNFRDLILKIYVDYSRLNGRYGMWIHWLKDFKELDLETKTFIQCISIWKDFLDTKKYNPRSISALPDLNLNQHPILYGRLFGLKLMAASTPQLKSALVRKMKSRISASVSSRIELLHEPAVQALVTRNKQLLHFVYEQLQLITEIYSWYNISQVAVLNVFHVSVLISKNEYSRALSILENIPLGHIRHGYRDFMDLYVSFFKYKIAAHLNRESETLLKDFQSKRESLNYKIFSDEYFHSYFVIPFVY
jgi:hypothetical protein